MEQQTILIVDDDREIVRVISKILELEGYKILKAYDGLEALDMLVGNVVHYDRYYDAEDEWSCGGYENPGDKQYPDYYFISEDRGNRQSAGIIHGSG